MNKPMRKSIEEISTLLEDLKQRAEALRDVEQEHFDNIPESLQFADKGEKMQEAIDSLDSAMDDLGSAIENLNTAKQ